MPQLAIVLDFLTRLLTNVNGNKVGSYNVLSLFSGAGGLDLGFKQSGFNIVWANDFDSDSVQTYNNNIGNHAVLGDITKIKSSEMSNNIDIVLGGFPCQGFSINNKNRSINDPRNLLYLELLRVVRDKQPKVFIGENVKGLLSMGRGKIFDMIVEDFKKIGYVITAKLINTSEYGVPQNRERIFIIGTKSREVLNLNIEKSSKKITTKDVIGYLSNVDISYSPIKVNDRYIYNHIASVNVYDKFFSRRNSPKQESICDYLNYYRSKTNISTTEIDKIFGYRYTAGHWFRKDNNSGSIPKPADWWRLKKILNFNNEYDKKVTEMEEKEIKFEQSLRIVNWDTPSDTITASVPEIHINKKRRLSVRECAILQTFPNDFIFTGSLSSMYRQVGNAVPVKIANQIATLIKEYL